MGCPVIVARFKESRYLLKQRLIEIQRLFSLFTHLVQIVVHDHHKQFTLVFSVSEERTDTHFCLKRNIASGRHVVALFHKLTPRRSLNTATPLPLPLLAQPYFLGRERWHFISGDFVLHGNKN